MQLAIAEAKRARDRGDYPIGAVITRVTDGREVVIASAGNRVKTSGSSIKHVELETLKYEAHWPIAPPAIQVWPEELGI